MMKEVFNGDVFAMKPRCAGFEYLILSVGFGVLK